MRTLLLESTLGAASDAAADLVAAGHTVARCHEPDTPVFPCASLTAADGCPLDGAAGVDVALVVRDGADPAPTAEEAGVTCALRQGVPVVVMGSSSFAGWVTAVAPDADPVAACEEAVGSSAWRRAEPLRVEVKRFLGLEGIEPHGVEVSIARRGDHTRISVTLPALAPPHLREQIATRVHAMDRAARPEAAVVDVAVEPARSR